MLLSRSARLTLAANRGAVAVGFSRSRARARPLLLPQMLGHLLVDGQAAWSDDDAIILPRCFDRHITIQHVAERLAGRLKIGSGRRVQTGGK